MSIKSYSYTINAQSYNKKSTYARKTNKNSKKNPQAMLEDTNPKVSRAIYPLEIAPLGQTSAQVPHSVHKSASIV